MIGAATTGTDVIGKAAHRLEDIRVPGRSATILELN
jgi:hypothetical protein